MALQGRIMDARNYKNLSPTNFDFCKIFKNPRKKLKHSRNLFVSVLYCTKRTCSQIEPQVEI